MPTPWKRDLGEASRQLADWLGRRLPAATDLNLSNLREPDASGFSNETLLCDLDFREDGRDDSRSLVVRIQPTGYQVFPSYDLSLQYRVMECLAATDVPVPTVCWIEEKETDVLGAPFYVMERVDGRVPPDRPPYHQGGWMLDVSPEERSAIWLGGFECMARIHRLDPIAVGLEFLDRPEPGAETPLQRELARYERYFGWAAAGRPQPIIEAAFEWLWRHQPADEPTCLVWGDARIGNILFDGTRPAAVLDWEMAVLGSPEMDVAWAIFLDRHHSEALGIPRLAGFPSYEDSLDFYRERSGHEVKHLHYYQVLAGFRFGVIMLRLAQQMVYYEVMDSEAGRNFELDNMVTNLLAKLLDLAPPGESAGQRAS